MPCTGGPEARSGYGGAHRFFALNCMYRTASQRFVAMQVHDVDELDSASLEAALHGEVAASAASAAAAAAAAAEDKKFSKPSRPGGGGRRILK